MGLFYMPFWANFPFFQEIVNTCMKKEENAEKRKIMMKISLKMMKTFHSNIRKNKGIEGRSLKRKKMKRKIRKKKRIRAENIKKDTKIRESVLDCKLPVE